METDLATIRSNFTDIPLLIGEWAASPVATETSARWRYFDHFIRTAAKYNTTTILWDNGADFLNRATHEWRDAVALDILRYAAKGTRNALPGGTTDEQATSQNSSAYIYHKLNSTVTDVELPFQFNGNTLKSATLAKNGKKLVEKKDFAVNREKETITFKKSFLSTILTPTANKKNPAPVTTGTLANITLAFTPGADLTVNILSYSTPKISGPTSLALPAASADIRIPIQWAGQNRPATVRAVKADGKFLVDDWTQYLGPLQQGRMTYGGQWDWDGEGVVLKAAVVEAVRNAGLTTVFRIEFYPRVEGNCAEFTVVV